MRLLEEMEAVSAPGSVLLTSMTPVSITRKDHGSSLLASWVWGFGEDFAEARFHSLYVAQSATLCKFSPGLPEPMVAWHAGVC